MQISLNGEGQEIEGEMSLSELLASLDIDARTVAIELSGAVIPRAAFSEKVVREGDKVEVVRFVQGG